MCNIYRIMFDVSSTGNSKTTELETVPDSRCARIIEGQNINIEDFVNVYSNNALCFIAMVDGCCVLHQIC